MRDNNNSNEREGRTSREDLGPSLPPPTQEDNRRRRREGVIARTESCVTFRDAEPMFRLSFSRVRRQRKKGGEAVETDISFSFILEALVSRSPGRYLLYAEGGKSAIGLINPSGRVDLEGATEVQLFSETSPALSRPSASKVVPYNSKYP